MENINCHIICELNPWGYLVDKNKYTIAIHTNIKGYNAQVENIKVTNNNKDKNTTSKEDKKFVNKKKNKIPS